MDSDDCYLRIEDTLAIHEVLAMYGHLIDERAWNRLEEVFLPEAIFYSTTGTVYSSLGELREFWAGGKVLHPAGHHVTNVILKAIDDETVESLSKGLYVHPDSSVTSATYRDTLRRTKSGWRLATRRISVPNRSANQE